MVSFVTNRSKYVAVATWWNNSAGLFVTLVSNNIALTQDMDFASQFSGAELSSTSFTAGFNGTMRKALTNTLAAESDADDQATLDADDVTWLGITAGTAYAAVVLRQSGSDALSEFVGYIDTGGFPVVTNGGDLSISWAGSGVFTLASG